MNVINIIEKAKLLFEGASLQDDLDLYKKIEKNFSSKLGRGLELTNLFKAKDGSYIASYMKYDKSGEFEHALYFKINSNKNIVKLTPETYDKLVVSAQPVYRQD